MNIGKLLGDVGGLLFKAKKWFQKDFRKSGKLAFNILLCIVVFLLTWNWFNFTFLKTEFEILSGPEKTTGKKYAGLITSEFNSSNRNLFGQDSMKETETEGFIANQSRIDDDETGKMVGFGQIGFGDSANSRVLLPLEFNYLHVLCRKELFDELAKGCDGCEKAKADQIVGKGKPQMATTAAPVNIQTQLGLFELLYAFRAMRERAYAYEPDQGDSSTGDFKDKEGPAPTIPKTLRIAAGSPSSGSRYLAERVLEHFRISFNKNGFSPNEEFFLYEDVAPQDVQAKLLNKDVDIVFYLGPANSNFVSRLFNDTFILDLGVHAEAISKSVSKTVLVDEFPAGLYGVNVPNAPSIEANSQLPKRLILPIPNQSNTDAKKRWHFVKPVSSDQITVLKTRRALICSKRMSNRDAFEIASVSLKALDNEIAAIDWNKLDADPSNQTLASVVKFHDGAKLLRDDRNPGIQDWLTSFWDKVSPLLVVALLTAFFGWLNSTGSNAAVTEDDSNGEASEGDNDEPMSPKLGANAGSTEGEMDHENNTAPDSSSQDLKETSKSVVYLRLLGSINHFMIELMLEPRSLTESRFQYWNEKMREVSSLIENELEQGNISNSEAKVLVEGMSELRYLFDSEFIQNEPGADDLTQKGEAPNPKVNESDLSPNENGSEGPFGIRESKSIVVKSIAYEQLFTSINHFMVKLKLEPRVLTKTRFNNWSRIVSELEVLISKEMRQNSISNDEFKTLCNGMEELKFLFKSEFSQKSYAKN